MVMTAEQKYAAVLQELGEVLQQKNTTISAQKWTIEELQAKLEHVKTERDEAVYNAKKFEELLNEADVLIQLLNEQIEELKGGAAKC